MSLSHTEAMDLQATELQRALTLLESLTASDWSAPTDCPAWDVRRMYLHVLGACEGGASAREQGHQMRAARTRQRAGGGPLEAALSAVQVDERERLSSDELLRRLREVAPRTVRSRRRLPALLRKGVRMKVDGPVAERWALGYLVDTIYLRDLWMHRVDACRAVGREVELTAAHDGRIIADVVEEWGRRHGEPYSLRLGGTAGGQFRGNGAALDAPVGHDLDAVEFCRILAGRAAGEGQLATIVPF